MDYLFYDKLNVIRQINMAETQEDLARTLRRMANVAPQPIPLTKVNGNGKCGLTWAEVKRIASRAAMLILDAPDGDGEHLIELSANRAIAEFLHDKGKQANDK